MFDAEAEEDVPNAARGDLPNAARIVSVASGQKTGIFLSEAQCDPPPTRCESKPYLHSNLNQKGRLCSLEVRAVFFGG